MCLRLTAVELSTSASHLFEKYLPIPVRFFWFKWTVGKPQANPWILQTGNDWRTFLLLWFLFLLFQYIEYLAQMSKPFERYTQKNSVLSTCSPPFNVFFVLDISFPCHFCRTVCECVYVCTFLFHFLSDTEISVLYPYSGYWLWFILEISLCLYVEISTSFSFTFSWFSILWLVHSLF